MSDYLVWISLHHLKYKGIPKKHGFLISTEEIYKIEFNPLIQIVLLLAMQTLGKEHQQLESSFIRIGKYKEPVVHE